ncbi:hypothetical protein AVEN_228650-1 [Araneus ventricosus]|uniref:Uncharacterized protein n=1 Tax=Araneus ventricosus TaxID=182803 RepID=A0A4Y2R6Q1_ARAVE|nr:hypothetical protein AVEN_228650-1 [Araneus ventricosus]
MYEDSRLSARRIFSGIGFRAWSSPASRPRPCHQATAASYLKEKMEKHTRMDILLNSGQPTGKMSESAPPSSNFRTTPAGGRLATMHEQQASYTVGI